MKVMYAKKDPDTTELTVGKEYPVLCVYVYDGQVEYLIKHDYRTVLNYPCTLFEVSDPTIPSHWELLILESYPHPYFKMQLVLGYPEIVNDWGHYDRLVEDRSVEDFKIVSREIKKINHQYTCRVCGFDQDFLPWGEDGKSKTHMLCGCCGVEFGYQDQDYDAVQQFRQKWLESGQVWFDDSVKPTGWTIGKDLGKQLMNIPREYK